MNPFTVARLHAGITQDHLSALTGVSQQLIQRAEDGLNNSPPATLAAYFTKHWINGPQRYGEPPALSAAQYWDDFIQRVMLKFPNKEVDSVVLRYLPPQGATNPKFKMPSFEAMYVWWTSFERWCLPDLKPILADFEDAIAVNGYADPAMLVVDLADVLREWDNLTAGPDAGKDTHGVDEWLIAKRLHVQLSTVQQFAKKQRARAVPPTIKRIIETTGRKHDEVF